MKDNFNSENSFTRIKNYRHQDGRPLLDVEQEEQIQLHIRPNKDVPRGLFKPDPLIPGGHIAHPVTIRALRNDIFVTGNDIDLNEKLISCPDCGKEIDLQFYKFCPYCECTHLPLDLRPGSES